jgi:hypothetical protein
MIAFRGSENSRIASLPPGASTRPISASPREVSAMFRRPKATVTRSNVLAGKGRACASASTHSTCVPDFRAFSMPWSSIGRQKSLATIRTSGPAARA